MDNKIKNKTDNSKNNRQWGGARKGAGRKKIVENRLDIKVYCRLSDNENNLLKEKAKEKNISVAEYIRQAVISKMTDE